MASAGGGPGLSGLYGEGNISHEGIDYRHISGHRPGHCPAFFAGHRNKVIRQPKTVNPHHNNTGKES